MLDLIKKLREETECSIGDCKKALLEASNDYEKAKRVLMLSASKAAAKKAHRETKEGIVATYLHSNKKIGFLVELLSETDFVAKNPLFSELAHNIAMHVAAMNPLYVGMENVPPDSVELIRREAETEVAKLGKPASIVKQIVEGKVNAYFAQQCLLTQPYIKDPMKCLLELGQVLVLSCLLKRASNVKGLAPARDTDLLKAAQEPLFSQ